MNEENFIAISVVMPVYNSDEFLAESIESILNQNFTCFEFIIIDDASTDNSWQTINSYAENDTRIRCFRNTTNQGCYPSRNRGILLAKANYIAVMDSDDVAFPERLYEQYSFLETHKTTLAVGTDFYFMEHEEQKAYLPISYEEIVLSLLNNNAILHSSLLIRKEILIKIGYYDEKYMFASDYDLLCKIALNGRIENIPKVLMRYRWHKNQISQKNQKLQKEYGEIIRCSNKQAIHEKIHNNNEFSEDILISLILPVCESDNNLQNVIESILNQSYANFELIIIDCSSTDKSISVVNQFQDSRIIIINYQHDIFDFINCDLKIAKGKYIVYARIDQVMSQYRLQRQLYFMESHCGIDICGSWRASCQGEILKYPCNNSEILLKLLYSNSMCYSTAMFRSKIIKTNNLCDLIRSTDFDEYKLWTDLAMQGYLFANIPEVLVFDIIPCIQLNKEMSMEKNYFKLQTQVEYAYAMMCKIVQEATHYNKLFDCIIDLYNDDFIDNELLIRFVYFVCEKHPIKIKYEYIYCNKEE